MNEAELLNIQNKILEFEAKQLEFEKRLNNLDVKYDVLKTDFSNLQTELIEIKSNTSQILAINLAQNENINKINEKLLNNIIEKDQLTLAQKMKTRDWLQTLILQTFVPGGIGFLIILAIMKFFGL